MNEKTTAPEETVLWPSPYSSSTIPAIAVLPAPPTEPETNSTPEPAATGAENSGAGRGRLSESKADDRDLKLWPSPYSSRAATAHDGAADGDGDKEDASPTPLLKGNGGENPSDGAQETKKS